VGALARVDPSNDRVADIFAIPAGAVSVRAGHGSLWVAYPDEDRVLRLDPSNGAVTGSYETGGGPRFLVVGPREIWVLNQGAGSVSRIDPRSDRVSATIAVDHGGMRGGDIAMGGGSVWVRGTTELVAEVDPVSATIVGRYGLPSVGSASVGVVDGQLWISAGAEGMLYRADIAELRNHRRAASSTFR
jgi:virginiamycin B lyase